MLRRCGSPGPRACGGTHRARRCRETHFPGCGSLGQHPAGPDSHRSRAGAAAPGIPRSCDVPVRTTALTLPLSEPGLSRTHALAGCRSLAGSRRQAAVERARPTARLPRARPQGAPTWAAAGRLLRSPRRCRLCYLLGPTTEIVSGSPDVKAFYSSALQASFKSISSYKWQFV